MSKTINLGKICLLDKGDYSSTTTYSKLDAVKSGQAWYYSLVDSNTGNALTDATKWKSIVNLNYAVEAETERVSAETQRDNAETQRNTDEQIRSDAESVRITNENARKDAETARVNAESSRVSAETSRVSAESSRVSAEASRVSAETSRESASKDAVENANAATNAANTAANKFDSAIVQTYGTATDKVMSQKATTDAKELLFRDMWNDACGSFGKYNTTTSYYELNGLTDLTYGEAVGIYNEFIGNRNNVNKISQHRGFKGRTNLPSNGNGTAAGIFGSQIDLTGTYINNTQLIYVQLSNSNVVYVSSIFGTFEYCYQLKSISPIIVLTNNYSNFTYAFVKCKVLENVKLSGVNGPLSFADSPLISYDSIKFLIDNKLNSTTAITVTVHATTYGYLTGTATDDAYTATGHTKAEWMAIVTSATAKALTFASA